MEGVSSESKRKEKKGAKETKSWKIERGFGSRKIRGERRKRDEGGGWNLGKIAKKNTEKGKEKPKKQGEDVGRRNEGKTKSFVKLEKAKTFERGGFGQKNRAEQK